MHTARSGCSRAILRISVRGGLSNQKECLVNAGIVAHALNMTLLLPHFDMIGLGNEKFEPNHTAYVGPYADRTRWGHFSHLFNATYFEDGLSGSLSLLPRLRSVIAAGKPTIVQLPTVETVTKGCANVGHVQGSASIDLFEPSSP